MAIFSYWVLSNNKNRNTKKNTEDTTSVSSMVVTALATRPTVSYFLELILAESGDVSEPVLTVEGLVENTLRRFIFFPAIESTSSFSSIWEIVCGKNQKFRFKYGMDLVN